MQERFVSLAHPKGISRAKVLEKLEKNKASGLLSCSTYCCCSAYCFRRHLATILLWTRRMMGFTVRILLGPCKDSF